MLPPPLPRAMKHGEKEADARGGNLHAATLAVQQVAVPGEMRIRTVEVKKEVKVLPQAVPEIVPAELKRLTAHVESLHVENAKLRNEKSRHVIEQVRDLPQISSHISPTSHVITWHAIEQGRAYRAMDQLKREHARSLKREQAETEKKLREQREQLAKELVRRHEAAVEDGYGSAVRTPAARGQLGYDGSVYAGQGTTYNADHADRLIPALLEMALTDPHSKQHGYSGHDKKQHGYGGHDKKHTHASYAHTGHAHTSHAHTGHGYGCYDPCGGCCCCPEETELMIVEKERIIDRVVEKVPTPRVSTSQLGRWLPFPAPPPDSFGRWYPRRASPPREAAWPLESVCSLVPRLSPLPQIVIIRELEEVRVEVRTRYQSSLPLTCPYSSSQMCSRGFRATC